MPPERSVNTQVAQAPSTIRVALIEDDVGTRRNLREIIESDPDCRCVGEFGSVAEAVAGLPALAPRCVLVDVNLPDGTGIDAVRRLALIMPDTEFVMLTLYHDGDLLFDALAAGAHGYLIKPVSVDTLLAAIHDVIEGGAPMSSMVARRIVRSFERHAPPNVAPLPKGEVTVDLAPREREVLDLLASGAMYKEVAKQLGVSRNTVITYIRRIYKKLHVHSRHHAVERYRRMQ
ncbi:MAG: response regulator transcription factor [Planctomycetia bacterium]|nr:response regulator transcription factor [Planctomycetia bacterium]